MSIQVLANKEWASLQAWLVLESYGANYSRLLARYDVLIARQPLWDIQRRKEYQARKNKFVKTYGIAWRNSLKRCANVDTGEFYEPVKWVSLNTSLEEFIKGDTYERTAELLPHCPAIVA